MSRKMILILMFLIIGYCLFQFMQNSQPSKKVDEAVAIGNYKSLSYIVALQRKDYQKLYIMLKKDIEAFIKNYDKNIYLKNRVLQNVCKDLTIIEQIIDDGEYTSQIKKIKTDCQASKIGRER